MNTINILHKFVNEVQEEFKHNKDVNLEYLTYAADRFINNNSLKEEDIIITAKNYIELPINKEVDEEERYYNTRIKEYDAFLAGVEYAKSFSI